MCPLRARGSSAGGALGLRFAYRYPFNACGPAAARTHAVVAVGSPLACAVGTARPDHASKASGHAKAWRPQCAVTDSEMVPTSSSRLTSSRAEHANGVGDPGRKEQCHAGWLAGPSAAPRAC